jgi:Cu-Zn family superoxide dismutase
MAARLLSRAAGFGASALGAAALAASESAVAVLGPSPADKADSGVRGTVTFWQPRAVALAAGADAPAPVRLRVRVSGLAPLSRHGFHVHALGDLTKGCMSAGGHWNPGGAPHGGPGDAYDARHAGDLGNVVADASGNVDVELEDALLTLRGPLSIVGRSVILHADEDDLGRGAFPDSKTTGHAGARIACGVIGLAEDAPPPAAAK